MLFAGNIYVVFFYEKNQTQQFCSIFSCDTEQRVCFSNEIDRKQKQKQMQLDQNSFIDSIIATIRIFKSTIPFVVIFILAEKIPSNYSNHSYLKY